MNFLKDTKAWNKHDKLLSWSNIIRVFPVKLKSKLLILSSPKFTHMKKVSVRPFISNFRSISELSQPWVRNWQHCGSEKKAFVMNPTPPTVFEVGTQFFFYGPIIKLQRASSVRIFDFHPGFLLIIFKIFPNFLTVDFRIKYWFFVVLRNFWVANSKIRLQEDLSNSVVSAPS